MFTKEFNPKKIKIMKKTSFYTSNGWAGKNYDSDLTGKEIAAKVRQYAKENHPEYNFSITRGWSGSSMIIKIRIKGGPRAPFVSGRTLLTTNAACVSGYEKDLDPEVYAALEDVCSYLQSFNYNDSDGMIDYFDANFYTDVVLDSEDYRITPPRSEKVAGPAKTAEAVSVPSGGGFEIVSYSDKAIAVFGDTRAVKDVLKALGGRFNPALRSNGEKRAGWVFSKRQEEAVRAAFANNN